MSSSRSAAGAPAAASSAARLRVTIMRDRERIARGERPAYSATWTRATDAIDVRIAEIPLVHIFVPDERGIREGARVLIARTLDVATDAFDVRLADPPGRADC
jgi:hypothetical protein